MIFYDFEVFAFNWMVVLINMITKKETVIIDNPEALRQYYEENKNNIWVGYNNKRYDQYIYKGILLGMDPKKINDAIIIKGLEGWQLSNHFREIPMINYDVMPNHSAGLKTLEGYMGSNIRETDIPFDINRKLTTEEIKQVVDYCQHDVEETIKVFLHNVDNFNALHKITCSFSDEVSVKNIGDSEARITAKVLDCQKRNYSDEFDYYFLSCLHIEKYKHIIDWFTVIQTTVLNNLATCSSGEVEKIKQQFYQQSYVTDVAGIPHKFGFGGLHGAPKTALHIAGRLYHVDVNNYYPSILLAHGLVTRSANNSNYDLVYQKRKELKYMQTHAETKEDAQKWKQMQLPYKKMLNALSGAMKDPTNPAFDPRNNNIMCINGQLMLLDLIEHLEKIKGFNLIQSNTDGLIIQISDTDAAFKQMKDTCHEWEQRCSTTRCNIRLELDSIAEIYQKDVNNYLWIDTDGNVERIGSYVKELSAIDYDLPIINQALVNYMVRKIPVEQTINDCTELIKFQKIVKLSKKYDQVEHEYDAKTLIKTSKHRDGTFIERYEYSKTRIYTNKSYRVFASTDPNDGRLLKVKMGKNGEKFASTPDHCFIDNGDVTKKKIPAKLDKSWYINLAKKRLKHFGIEV